MPRLTPSHFSWRVPLVGWTGLCPVLRRAFSSGLWGGDAACGGGPGVALGVLSGFGDEEVEVGEPKRTYTVEPLEDPVPREAPSEPSEELSAPEEVKVE